MPHWLGLASYALMFAVGAVCTLREFRETGKVDDERDLGDKAPMTTSGLSRLWRVKVTLLRVAASHKLSRVGKWMFVALIVAFGVGVSKEVIDIYERSALESAKAVADADVILMMKTLNSQQTGVSSTSRHVQGMAIELKKEREARRKSELASQEALSQANLSLVNVQLQLGETKAELWGSRNRELQQAEEIEGLKADNKRIEMIAERIAKEVGKTLGQLGDIKSDTGKKFPREVALFNFDSNGGATRIVPTYNVATPRHLDVTYFGTTFQLQCGPGTHFEPGVRDRGVFPIAIIRDPDVAGNSISSSRIAVVGLPNGLRFNGNQAEFFDIQYPQERYPVFNVRP